MSDILTMARGDSFSFAVDWVPEAAAPATVELVTITSQVRDLLGALVADVVIVKDVDFLGFSVDVLDTTAWPLGQLEWDIKCVIAGRAIHSSKVLLNITKAVTA